MKHGKETLYVTFGPLPTSGVHWFRSIDSDQCTEDIPKLLDHQLTDQKEIHPEEWENPEAYEQRDAPFKLI